MRKLTVVIVIKSFIKTNFLVLENKTFRTFYAGQISSQIGFWLQLVALNWIVYQNTNSVFAAAVVSFCRLFSSAVASPFFGPFADSFDNRRILIFIFIGLFFQNICLTFISYLGIKSYIPYAILAFIAGVANGIEAVCRQTLVVQFIDKKELSGARKLQIAAINLSRILGPAIAGILIAAVGAWGAFLLNSLTCIPIIFALIFLNTKPPVKSSKSFSMLQQQMETLKYLKELPGLKNLVILPAMINFPLLTLSILYPFVAKNILAGDATAYTELVSISGIGAVLGVIFFGGSDSDSGEKLKLKVIFGLLIGALCFFYLGFAKAYWEFALISFIVGSLAVILQSNVGNRLQLRVEDKHRGRVTSFYLFSILAGVPFGHLVFGKMLENFSLYATSFSIATYLVVLSQITYLMKIPD